MSFSDDEAPAPPPPPPLVDGSDADEQVNGVPATEIMSDDESSSGSEAAGDESAADDDQDAAAAGGAEQVAEEVAAAASPAALGSDFDFDDMNDLDDLMADRARSGARTAGEAPYAGRVSMLGAAETAAQVPAPVVLDTPSHSTTASAVDAAADSSAASEPPHARTISVDPSTPQPAPNGAHMHLPEEAAATGYSAPAGLFSPTRPVDTPMAANAALNIFSPTRPAHTPAANAPPPPPPPMPVPPPASSPASSPSSGLPALPPRLPARPPRPSFSPSATAAGRGAVGAGASPANTSVGVSPANPGASAAGAGAASAGAAGADASVAKASAGAGAVGASTAGASAAGPSAAGAADASDASGSVTLAPYSRRQSLLNKSHLSFKTSLKHQFPLLDSQVGAGQALVKRVSTFLKRVCDMTEAHAAALLKLAQAEEGRSESARLSDSMADHVKAANQVAGTVEALATRDSLFAQKVLGQVVKPLLLWLPVAEERRAKLNKDERAASTTMFAKNTEAEKIRLAGVKHWNELRDARKDLNKEKSAVAPAPAAMDKALKKVAKLKESARKEFAKFEGLKDSIISRTIEFRSITMPTLLSAMEDLERERLNVMRKALAAYAGLLREAAGPEPAAPLSILRAVEEQVALLNPTVDMNGAMDRWVTAHGLPPADPPMVLDLPCHSEHLAPDSNAWEAAMTAPPMSAAVAPTPGSPAGAAAFSAAHHLRQPSSSVGSGLGSIEEDGSGGGSTTVASSSSSHAASPPIHESGGDDDDDDDEDDTLSTPFAISESWYVAQVDHPLAQASTPPAPLVRASSSSTSISANHIPSVDDAASPPPPPPPAPTSAASSPSGVLMPLLHFRVDDIVRVTDKSCSAAAGGEGWWVGSLVSDLSGSLGRFPRSMVRSVDDKDARAPVVEAAGADGQAPLASLADILRGKVSKKKKRFQQDGFDLDLTYILDNIIAMGFPSEGLEGQYRNNMIDVQRFFKTRHPENYKLYNLCSERFYDIAGKFEGRGSRYGFDDHNPCPFDMIVPIMKDLDDHINPGGVHNPNRVAAIHCKAGKGRTGFIICCWLLYNRMFPNYDPSLALRYYAVKRTKNQKGVTIPSQIRYVYYFARYLRWERGLARFPTIPSRNPVLLQTIRLLGIPRATTGKDVWFKLVQNDGSKFSSKGKASLERRLAEDYLLFQARDASGQGITSLNNDCHITFFMGGLFDTTKLFQFWFNTRMIGNVMDPTKENNEAEVPEDTRHRSLILTKAELDKACKDVHHKLYADTFRVELIFTSP